jgi:hypothetical protein
MSAQPLADGPAMYFGGTIMTFALPLGAFIAAALALFFLFRARHSGPRLTYLTSTPVASVTTREPGPAPAPAPEARAPEARAPEAPAPEAPAPEAPAPAAPELGGGQT